MSIKKLFGSTDTSRNYLSDTSKKDAFKNVESAQNVAEIYKKQQRFVPQIDYLEPKDFAKYGSARLYYNSAINRIADYYPYDGSEYEITEFHNKSLDIEEYIFENRYPRTNGYARFSANGWGTRSSTTNGYGLPLSQEYIEFTGGPHTIGIVGESDASEGVAVSGSSIAALFPDDSTSKRTYSNVYDETIYTTAGLESGSYLSGSPGYLGATNYGTGSRGSNLECNFDKGVTIEFWLKKDAFDTDLTTKEVIFDIWNDEAIAQHDYGRVLLSIEKAPGDPPFILTVYSGSTGFTDKRLGSSEVTEGTLANSSWKHYAITMQNSGSNFVTKLYVTGALDHTDATFAANIGTLPPKTSAGAMGGRIGALAARAPGGGAEGAGKLSASLDELRFWKAARTSDEIGRNWFTHVRGGTNTDISNTTLGLYYKFNEGITGTASLDNSVLDYSGRLSNGNWVGYDSTVNTSPVQTFGTYGRMTGSAIVESTASATEFKDPIIRSTHPDVVTLKNDLLSKGANHDFSNNAAFKSLIPSWVVEEQDSARPDELVPTFENNIEMVSHVIGAYFDKLRLQIKALPSLRHMNYTSASHTPIPFAQHLPQSLGLYMPELFVDSTVLERFMNRNPTMLFEGDLNETKNLIYQNLYNNLTNIYKSKGTEKAIRNVFRCFNLDDKLVRLNVYSNNEIYELKDNLRQTLINKKVLNFNTASNMNAVVYQAKAPAGGYEDPAQTRGYISGSAGAGLPTGSNTLGYELPYGFTLETDIVFPHYPSEDKTFARDYTEVSLFGMHSASTDDKGDRPSNNTLWYANDNVSFQVYAIKEDKDSKNVYFKLTSSLTPSSTTDLAPFPTLTSSYFNDVYDDTRWNISVRLKPTNFGVTNMVSGAINSDYKYDLVFQGLNSMLGTIQNSFTLTASIPQDKGTSFLTSSKRLYVGARRRNITGSYISASCDVLFNNAKYWGKYVDDSTLKQHAHDLDNSGISGSWRNVSPLDVNLTGSGSVLNSNMLVLDWRFNNLTSSGERDGEFYVRDFSSGSTQIKDHYGWVGEMVGYQHGGSGSGWPDSSQNIIATQSINAFQFINPEYAVSSDMIRILSNDDIYFGTFETPPDYRYTLEKSMYNAISEEILDFFAGVIDFHNIIGEPINRYRGRYKRLEKLREIFFRRIGQNSGSNNDGVTYVEDFIEYYKWFDDAIAEVIGQLLPASANFNTDAYNTIESHVLERNKYRTKFPTIENRDVDPESSTWGSFKKTEWSPPPSSPRPTDRHPNYWRFTAERSGAAGTLGGEISSGDGTVDAIRNIIRDIVAGEPTMPSSLPLFRDAAGTIYQKSQGSTRKNSFVSPIATRDQIIGGGVNFPGNKNIHFTYNALYPAGPINREDGGYVPLNVLYALTDATNMVGIDEVTARVKNFPENRKLKRVLKTVQHGRNWQDGGGYSNTKSTYAFPFNIMSSSVKTGFNAAVVNKATGGIEITNLHNDVYGNDMEVPLQGPFTEHHVGGHQSRHVSLNTGSTLDTIYTRPEAWKILLGRCPNTSGAIGMAGPDYPWPEANDDGANPYPVTASQKATYYRDGLTKKPVNIKNIRQTTSSVLGNYSHNLQVVSTIGASSNPRRWRQVPTMPDPIVNLVDTVRSSSTNVVSFYSTLRRNDDSHFDFDLEWAPPETTGSDNQSIIVGRFGAPGGLETMARGFLDIRGAEYSPYNSIAYRNLGVTKPFQNSSSVSEATGSGLTGLRAYDHLGKDYGTRVLLSRHSEKFGRDSRFETAEPGATYNQLPNFHKVHRNRVTIINSSSTGYSSGSDYDNAYVSRPIPRADRQYSWMSATLLDTNDMRMNQYAPTNQSAPEWRLGYFSSSADFVPWFTFVSGSDIETTTGIYQPVNGRLNILTLDPVSGGTSSDNIIGFPTASNNTSYFNSVFIDGLPAAESARITGSTAGGGPANYFNLLMARRGNTFGWNWRKIHQGHNPINVKEISGANISIAKDATDKLTLYRLTPVATKGRPVVLNFDAPKSTENTTANGNAINNITVKATDNNYRIISSNAALDNFLIRGDILRTPYSVITPYKQILSLAKSEKYMLHWIMRSQGIYPSDYNEFYQTTFTRTGFDNKFWRTGRADRKEKANNSFNVPVSQSKWCLDAQDDFESRTRATMPSPSYVDSISKDIGQIVSGAAGELQNNYFFYTDTRFSVAYNTDPYSALKPAALISRKCMLTSPKAVSPWKNIAEVGGDWNKGEFNSASMTKIPEPYGGEAKWEADTQAGIITNVEGTASFVAAPSKPWWDKYADFQHDLKLAAKNYAIIPEFRISEHVEDFISLGISNSTQSGSFKIPGTALSSSEKTFYKDYSNSEFLTDFLNMPADTLLDAKEIRMKCDVAIRFNPYKGFYPAQRTLDLVSQFSRSFQSGFLGKAANKGTLSGDELVQTSGSVLTPLLQPLFAPGIMYNSIKSGMAVEYPLLLEPSRFVSIAMTASNKTTDNHVLTSDSRGQTVAAEKYSGGRWPDKTLPFEAIIDPATYIKDLKFYNVEPHPSCSLNVTCSWTGEADSIYSMMASNFFGAVPNFFLKDGGVTTLKSGIISDNMRFEKGDVFGARLILQRSTTGKRIYNFELSATGAGAASWAEYGFIAWSGSASTGRRLDFTDVEVPQDPYFNPNFGPNFTLYSNPTSFGPPVSGRPGWTGDGHSSGSDIAQRGNTFGVLDSFTGHNWLYTPPCADGQCWVDFVFRPDPTVDYDLPRIMTETSGVYRRVDPGPITGSLKMKEYMLIPAAKTGALDVGPPYGGANINDNAMQLSASFILDGIETVDKQEVDEFGNLSVVKNESAGKRWVIQSKWETPHMNFSPEGIRPITNANDTLTLPTYASCSVPRGMWHQFGARHSNADEGITISWNDISDTWLQGHYDVTINDTIYNDFNAGKNGPIVHKQMQSLTKLLGFDKKPKKRMGELADKQIIKECVVAVPYIIVGNELSGTTGQAAVERKKFINIPKNRWKAALEKGTAEGDSLDTAGASIRRLKRLFDDYVFPPMFDCKNNPNVKPIVMYGFEFEYELDIEDLSYIWQNLAPRDYQKIHLKSACQAHKLSKKELLDSSVLANENLRWMVFKVKQKGFHEYSTVERLKETANIVDIVGEEKTGYPIKFNWPYDFVSIVELAKIETQILYKRDEGMTSVDDNHAHTYGVNDDGVGETSYNDEHYHEIIDGIVQEADGHTHSLESEK